jgi:hypothetical protein
VKCRHRKKVVKRQESKNNEYIVFRGIGNQTSRSSFRGNGEQVMEPTLDIIQYYACSVCLQFFFLFMQTYDARSKELEAAKAGPYSITMSTATMMTV